MDALLFVCRQALADGKPQRVPTYADAWLRIVQARGLALSLTPSLRTGDASLDDALHGTPWLDALEEVPLPRIPEMALAETFDLPIFINCRDRLTCLRRLVDWLLGAGYRRIYLLDNASTYPPLRAYYEEVCRDPRVTLVQLPANLGFQALWASGLLHELGIRTPYVYTDPDVVPIEGCPRGLVARLYQLLRRYPFVAKVGPGLFTEDVSWANGVAIEQSFCHVPVEEGVYFAPCDTTFALYAPSYHYTNFTSLRTRGRLLVRHLSWYLDHAHLPEDESYYIAHADRSSSFAQVVKEGR